jgi:hypothetical protein
MKRTWPLHVICYTMLILTLVYQGQANGTLSQKVWALQQSCTH